MKRIKHTLVVLIAIMTFSFSFLGNSIDVKASTNGHTQQDAVTWAKNQLGKALDYDGQYGAQCVDLIDYYYQYLGQAIPWCNYAKDFVNGPVC